MPFLLSRRALLVAAVPAATAAPDTPSARSPAQRAALATPADSPLVARLLAATEEHRAANDAARAASYDKRNFEDYMGFEIGTSGAMRGVKPETRAAIEAWMDRNGVKR